MDFDIDIDGQYCCSWIFMASASWSQRELFNLECDEQKDLNVDWHFFVRVHVVSICLFIRYAKMSLIFHVSSHVSRGLAILHWALQRKTSKGWVQRCCRCLAWHTGWNRMAPSLRRLLVKIYMALTVHGKREYSSIHIAATEAKNIINTYNVTDS